MSRAAKHEAFYHSGAWQQCRKAYIAQRRGIDGGLCEICHETPGKIVHHKQELNASNVDDADVSLAFDKLQYVCKGCHDKIHGYAHKQQRQSRVWFDAFGNAHSHEAPRSEEPVF